VDLWVKNMIDTLRCLHPVHHNVPAVWNKFEKEFRKKFVDSTAELRARNHLDKLKFKYPDINSHIQCLKKLVKCFELFDCSENNSRTREGKNMSLVLFKSP